MVSQHVVLDVAGEVGELPAETVDHRSIGQLRHQAQRRDPVARPSRAGTDATRRRAAAGCPRARRAAPAGRTRRPLAGRSRAPRRRSGDGSGAGAARPAGSSRAVETGRRAPAGGRPAAGDGSVGGGERRRAPQRFGGRKRPEPRPVERGREASPAQRPQRSAAKLPSARDPQRVEVEAEQPHPDAPTSTGMPVRTDSNRASVAAATSSAPRPARRGTAPAGRAHERLQLFRVTLVAPALLASRDGSVELQAAEVVDHARPAGPEDIDPLLRQRAVLADAVGDRRRRAAREPQRREQRAVDARRRDARRRPAGEERRQIDEVRDLPEHGPSLLGPRASARRATRPPRPGSGSAAARRAPPSAPAQRGRSGGCARRATARPRSRRRSGLRSRPPRRSQVASRPAPPCPPRGPPPPSPRARREASRSRARRRRPTVRAHASRSSPAGCRTGGERAGARARARAGGGQLDLGDLPQRGNQRPARERAGTDDPDPERTFARRAPRDLHRAAPLLPGLELEQDRECGGIILQRGIGPLAVGDREPVGHEARHREGASREQVDHASTLRPSVQRTWPTGKSSPRSS